MAAVIKCVRDTPDEWSVVERKHGRATAIEQDPVSVVRQYIDAFNKGAANALAFAVPGAILH